MNTEIQKNHQTEQSQSGIITTEQEINIPDFDLRSRRVLHLANNVHFMQVTYQIEAQEF